MSALSAAPPLAAAAHSAVVPPVRASVARGMVVVGLAIQILGIAYAVFVEVGVGAWIGMIQQGSGQIIAGTIVLLGAAALLLPVLRGGRWTLVLTVLLLALLLPAAVPAFIYDFPRPAGFVTWLLATTITLSAVVAIGFGIVALLETFGRLRGQPFLAAGGALSRQGALAALLVAAWAGMVVLALAVSQAPAASGAIRAIPAVALMLPMEGSRFIPASLDLKVGQSTALVLTNRDNVPHSFDVDALNIHVSVPPGTTALAVITPAGPGTIAYRCAVPGHTEAGMVGTLVAQP